MECAENFIVCRNACSGVDPVTPTSGLYADDLPGISTISLANIEPGKYASAAAMVQQKVAIAVKKVGDRVKEVLAQYLEENATVEAGEVGTFNSDVLAGTADARGLRIGLDGTQLMHLLIPRIYVKAAASGEFEVLLKDGPEERTFTVNCVANEVAMLDVHYLAKTKQVDITITDAAFKAVSGTTFNTRYFATCVACGRNCKYRHISGVGLLKGEEVDAVQGIGAQVVVTCAFERALCMLLQRLRWAVLYQFGVEVLDEWLATSRMNYMGIHGKEWAEAKRPEWMQEVEIKLEQQAPHLATLIEKLSPECTRCGRGLSYGYALP